MIINTIIIVQKCSNIHVYYLFEIIINNIKLWENPSPKSSFAPALRSTKTTCNLICSLYRVHDHRQTQADRVS